jgi:hypothetical protein
VLGAGALAGCMREASDLDAHRRHTGTAPWSVEGVRPGDALGPHLTRLGPPARTTKAMASDVRTWTSPGPLSVVTDAAGVVTDVTADSVESEGQDIVWSGLGQAEIERILGRGRVQKVTRPGSGVISIFGGKEVGRVLTYENQGVRFELQLDDDTLNRVRAFRPAAR